MSSTDVADRLLAALADTERRDRRPLVRTDQLLTRLDAALADVRTAMRASRTHPGPATPMPRPQQFSATIVSDGATTFVVLPFDPHATWSFKERHHVTGSINGYAIRGPLRVVDRQIVLPLGAAWRRDTGLEAGAAVTVALLPEGPQADTLAPDVRAALAAAPAAMEYFESLATFYRKNYLRWIEGAKRPDTRQARIAEVITLLAAGRKQR